MGELTERIVPVECSECGHGEMRFTVDRIDEFHRLTTFDCPNCETVFEDRLQELKPVRARVTGPDIRHGCAPVTVGSLWTDVDQ